MAPVHMPHGWQLVYIVVRAATSGASSRAAQRASFSSGWALMSSSRRTVLCASARTAPSGPASSDPYGASPRVTACAAMATARRRSSSSAEVVIALPSRVRHRAERLPGHLAPASRPPLSRSRR
jgi:hypothetical protein